MGNQQTSSNNKSNERKKEKRETIIDIKNNSFLNPNSKDEISSYKGIKTDDFSSSEIKEGSKRDESTECQTIPEKSNLKDFKIPTLFEWNDGGNVVYITGNFSNWTQWFMMNKIDKNKFQLNLVKKII